MTVSLNQIYSELRPGLAYYGATPKQWGKLFAVFTAPEVTVVSAFDAAPLLSLQAVLLGAAGAAIIKNPVVSRRFWSNT